jgi:hypothetical protein
LSFFKEELKDAKNDDVYEFLSNPQESNTANLKKINCKEDDKALIVVPEWFKEFLGSGGSSLNIPH